MKQYKRLTTITVILAAAACAPLQQQGSAPATPQYGIGQQFPTSIGEAAELALISILVEQLGISSQQAMGGVGSIFSIAKQRMAPAEFAQVSRAVPGMDQYLSAAVPQQVAANAGTAGLLSVASAALGGQNSEIASLATLAGSFQSLGMKSSMIGKFVPVMLQYVQQQGGPTTMALLDKALR